MGSGITPASERKCTNIPAFIFCIILLAITVGLVAFCGFKAATRESKLIDDCGNICGEANEGKNFDCGDPDKRNQPKLMFKIKEPDTSTNSTDIDYDLVNDKNNNTKILEYTSECVASCPPTEYFEVFDRCIPVDKSVEDYMDKGVLKKVLKNSWIYTLAMCAVAFFFSYIFLVLFRHAAKLVIWVINISSIVLMFGVAIFAVLVGQAIIALVFILFGLALLLTLFLFRKRINMVAKLFKESSKALIDVSGLMFEPIMTFLSLLIAFVIFIAFAVIITLAGEEEPMAAPAHAFNIVSFLFFTQFITGCQNFIIAGSVAKWYFTRDKSKLGGPIKKSFYYLWKFHLGSICLGAILITVVKLVRSFCSYLKNQAARERNWAVAIIMCCISCIVDILYTLLKYLVRNSYIIIAKEGTPFIQSGKRASELLLTNIVEVISLNRFGDIVLFVCRLLVTVIAGLVGYSLLMKNLEETPEYLFPLIVGIIFALLIAHCFVMVFEMTVDTIFVCFCIDLEENDGVTSPYYMSEGLKKIMIEMKGQKGGTLNFGPKGMHGMETGMMNDGSGIPMLPKQQGQQPMYPNINSSNPMNPQMVYPMNPQTNYQPNPYGNPPSQKY